MPRNKPTHYFKAYIEIEDMTDDELITELQYGPMAPKPQNSADSGAGAHISQHSNGTESAEICPQCNGFGHSLPRSYHKESEIKCQTCGGSGTCVQSEF